ncbi:MAG: agmatine/peptidylarginine deiminase, partial [Candidatus Kryptoniota bacterium]
MSKSPSKLGCCLPAEWERHEATWLGWPHNKSDWPGKFSPIPWVYAEIVKRISQGEKARIIVESKEHEKKARAVLKASTADSANIEFFTLKTDRGWTRDSGPVFVKSQDEVAQVNFKFNGWAKYSDYKKDAKLPDFISKEFCLTSRTAEHKLTPVVLEGGAIDTNGHGTLIATEECLLDENIQTRNPRFSKKDYEKVFENYLGITNVLWLGKGISGDDTHGHIDDLCRFANSKTLLLVQERNPRNDNYIILEENKVRLMVFRLEDGSRPEVVFLPMPEPVIFRSQRLPA